MPQLLEIDQLGQPARPRCGAKGLETVCNLDGLPEPELRVSRPGGREGKGQ